MCPWVGLWEWGILPGWPDRRFLCTLNNRGLAGPRAEISPRTRKERQGLLVVLTDPMFRSARIRSKILFGAAVVAVCLIWANPVGAQPSRRSAARAKPKAPPIFSAVPFHEGEKLNYQVLFSKYSVKAAQIETSVVGQRNFFGHPVWHFRAVANTTNTMRLLFNISDQFDSYTSVGSLVSLQYEMYLNEQDKQKTTRYRMTTDDETAPPGVTALRVLPDTRDPLDFLYGLRAVDWRRVKEFRAPVYDGRRLDEAIAHLDRPEGTVQLQAGSVTALRIAVQVLDHGKEVPDTRFWVWLAKDKARTPVLIEAELPIGTFRVELTHLP